MFRIVFLFSFLLVFQFAKAAPSNLDRFSNAYKIMDYDELMSLSKEDRKEYIQSLQRMFVELETMEKKSRRFTFLENLFERQYLDPVEQIDMASRAPGMPSLGPNGRVECKGKMPGSTQALVPYRIYAAKPPAPTTHGVLARLSGWAVLSDLRAGYIDWLGMKKPVPENPRDFVCRAIIAEIIDTAGCEKGFSPGQARWKQTLPNGIKENFSYLCFTETSFGTLPKEKQTHMQRFLGDIIARRAAREKPRTLRTTPPPSPALRSVKRTQAQPNQKLSAVHAFESDIATENSGSFCSDLNARLSEFPDQPDVKTCNDQIIADFREKFYRGPESLCIYGGNLSQYANSEKRAGACSPRSQFCVESLDCKNPATGDRWKPTFQCAANQVICNPLLFGIQGDGKTPYCVSRGAHATAQCEAISPKADTASWENVSGMREAWNLFSQSFNKFCAPNTDGAQFFCRECHAMKRRMFYMNVGARNLSSCQQVIDGSSAARVSGRKNSGAR